MHCKNWALGSEEGTVKTGPWGQSKALRELGPGVEGRHCKNRNPAWGQTYALRELGPGVKGRHCKNRALGSKEALARTGPWSQKKALRELGPGVRGRH
ncbi:hypothetical protein NDU88_000649 [Pleurodeles waltl]|uniref:Uncharacterized protein n=1 Tax=Pleurodeles waltl TaxID=8319 RepID=A0AAV7Q4T6_PLEWA|nr:hypothetical protein NDU88_000649 [Pleurodeles waltl]